MTLSSIYSPLQEQDHIRLLLLQSAASRDEELVGSLQHISLNSHHYDLIEPYTALSYVWGQMGPADTIVLGGRECGITANLGAALRDLRDPGRSHRIWADALCIDQANILERNQQVALMAQIYLRADHTVIYLGALTPHAEIVLREINRGVLLNVSGPSSSPSSPVVTAMEEVILESLNEGILSQPWFHRVWVLQELVLSRDPWVQFERQRMRWTDLCRLVIPILKDQKPSWEKRDLTVLECMNEVRDQYWRGHYATRIGGPVIEEISGDHGDFDDGRGGGPRRLWRLIDMRRDCGATDPRDLVFAHLGIISDRDEAMRYIRIDYTQTTAEVFTAAGRYINRRAGISSLIGFMRLSSRAGDSGLPSWAPSWEREITEDFSGTQHQNTPGYSATGAAEAFPIEGVAKILHVSSILTPSSLSSPDDFNQRIEDYFQQVARSGRRDTSPWADFVDTLIAAGVENAGPDGFALRSWPTARVLSNNEGGEEEPPLERQIFRLLTEYCYGKHWRPPHNEARLALLNNGTVMFVPKAAAGGDVAALLSWSPNVEYGVFDLETGYHKQDIVIVRPHLFPRDINASPEENEKERETEKEMAEFEHEYISRYVAAIGAIDKIWNKGVNELLFLHAILVGACQDPPNQSVQVRESWHRGAALDATNMLTLVSDWSRHDVTEKLGRRVAPSGLSNGMSFIMVLH